MATPVLTPTEERRLRQQVTTAVRFAGDSKSAGATVSSIIAAFNRILADRK